VVAVERTTRRKSFVSVDELPSRALALLDSIQAEMLDTARRRVAEHTSIVDSYDDFRARLDEPGGFVLAHWGGDAATEALIKEETGATIRCIAFDTPDEREGPCIRGPGRSTRRAHFARAY